jgi:hypothetical protein
MQEALDSFPVTRKILVDFREIQYYFAFHNLQHLTNVASE